MYIIISGVKVNCCWHGNKDIARWLYYVRHLHLHQPTNWPKFQPTEPSRIKLRVETVTICISKEHWKSVLLLPACFWRVDVIHERIQIKKINISVLILSHLHGKYFYCCNWGRAPTLLFTIPWATFKVQCRKTSMREMSNLGIAWPTIQRRPCFAAMQTP